MSADEFGMSAEEFQFFKEKLQKNVKEYLELEEQITALKKAVKERTESRKRLSEEILENMKKLDLNHMNIKDGKLVYKVTNNYKSITQKALSESLQSVFKNNDEAAQEAFKNSQGRPKWPPKASQKRPQRPPRGPKRPLKQHKIIYHVKITKTSKLMNVSVKINDF